LAQQENIGAQSLSDGIIPAMEAIAMPGDRLKGCD
jgi:hypothetical protein